VPGYEVRDAPRASEAAVAQQRERRPDRFGVARVDQFVEQVARQVTEARSRVASARESHDVSALGRAEGMLRQGLGQIFAVVEAYPELKANEHFMQLQTRITALENAIADRREWYNESVNVHNVRIDIFPDAIVARMFRFVAQPLLQS
jgi:LemA protein